jgi:hypothetical protein
MISSRPEEGLANLLSALLVIPCRQVVWVFGRCVLVSAAKLKLLLENLGATESGFFVLTNPRLVSDSGLFNNYFFNESWCHDAVLSVIEFAKDLSIAIAEGLRSTQPYISVTT